MKNDAVFLPDNPCELFYQLSKSSAAKRAGHDNAYDQVNTIGKGLMELGFNESRKIQKCFTEALLSII